MEHFAEMGGREDIPEISSTASRTENRRAFYNKLQSRKYKCLLTLMMSVISFFLVIWFAVLSRATLEVLQKLEFDFTEMKEVVQNMSATHLP